MWDVRFAGRNGKVQIVQDRFRSGGLGAISPSAPLGEPQSSQVELLRQQALAAASRGDYNEQARIMSAVAQLQGYSDVGGAPAADKQLVIPRITPQIVELEVVGTTPLLVCAWSVKA